MSWVRNCAAASGASRGCVRHDLRMGAFVPITCLQAWVVCCPIILAGAAELPPGVHAQPEGTPGVGKEGLVDPRELAANVVIRRDRWGTPHISGPTDAAVVFGFAYAQAEDFFWQIEDSYILGLGRYSEVHGPAGLNSDLLNRAFEVVPQARADFAQLEPELKRLCAAFAAGLNYYLHTHPQVQPRLIKWFEPWHVLAFGRHLTLELTFRYTRLTNNYLPRLNPMIAAAPGSNAWAIGPQRTRSGRAMLLVNPHQPWFGFGQFYEAHLTSGEGWSFSGATFFGSPLPSLGHNEHLGWSFCVNEPDIADVWRETFDHPSDPLLYRYADGWRRAEEWQEVIRVKSRSGFRERTFTLRKTHHGPIVARESQQHQLAARIARLDELVLLRQMLRLVRARNLAEFQEAMALQQFPIMNVVYADRHGEIYFLYNGIVPRRDPQFDWSQPLDGSDPRTEWQGFHALDELPQVRNPPCGFVQNCNSSPFTTADDGNPDPANFPPYMVEDKEDDKRRAQRSRELLRAFHAITLEDLQQAAFDTTLYWARHELPAYAAAMHDLERTRPALADQARPYLDHLLNWDCRITPESTQATLCTAWYQELYGPNYPGETLKPTYAQDMAARFEALIRAARYLRALYGDWRVPWRDVYRMQRHANVADLVSVPFDDRLPSLPCMGGHGPMGIVFTQYYTPAVNIPFFKVRTRRYGVVGCTYLGVYEFAERVRGATLLHFGTSGDPTSEHYFDQAQLLSERRMKPELFDAAEVLSATVRAYHPGEPSLPPAVAVPTAE